MIVSKDIEKYKNIDIFLKKVLFLVKQKTQNIKNQKKKKKINRKKYMTEKMKIIKIMNI